MLTGARYRYAGASAWALDGLDLAVEPGEVVGVVGANESGKSTLCLVAAGLAPVAIGGQLAGAVDLGGSATASLRPFELAQRAGILFENSATQLSGTSRSVYEEVAFGPRNLGLPLEEVVARVEDALRTLGIEALAARDPARLSGGQAQLVALASVLALRPPLLVLDEPTSQLDPQGTRLVGEALAGLASNGSTSVLIVEHKTDLLARLAGRIVVLEGGAIDRAGPVDEVLADPDLRGLGVEPPSLVSIRRALDAAGIGVDRSILEAADRDDGPPLDNAAGQAGRAAADTAPAATRTTGGTSAIEVVGVGFVYPDGTRALAAVDLSVPVGQRIAIVGQNGSGKSTLVRQFNGLLRPTEGRVLIGGRETRDRHVADLARDVGLAFQDPDRQIFAGRVRAEVAFGPRNLGLRGAALDEAVERALQAVGLAGDADAHPYDLGYSRRKLLALASVLAMGTPIVVLDEPTTGQDARGVARIRAIVDALHAAGRTVVAISHDMRFVAESFERVVVMRDGRVVIDGSPAEAFAEQHWATLASTYIEPPLAARVGARLGLGSTPTERALVEAAASRP